eukprot:1128002-Pelagomonas_calceolata.AAC.1
MIAFKLTPFRPCMLPTGSSKIAFFRPDHIFTASAGNKGLKESGCFQYPRGEQGCTLLLHYGSGILKVAVAEAGARWLL